MSFSEGVIFGEAVRVLAEERRTRLLELVRQRGFASLPELVEQLQVSESTIRRDLDSLEEAGTARRTHGGVFYTGQAPLLPHFEERQPENWAQKQAIAECVAELIQTGDTLLLDGGTTTYEVARRLVGRALQIVTNSLPVANLFASSPQTDLVMLGGYIYPRTGVSVGPYTNDMLKQLNVRKTILSVAGITERGYFNSNLLLVETERAMMQAADEVIVVADSTKFGKQSLALISPLSEAKFLVADGGLSSDWENKVRNAGVHVILGDAAKHSTEK